MCEVKAEKSEDNSGLIVNHHLSVKGLSYEIYVNICFISATHPLVQESAVDLKRRSLGNVQTYSY